MVGGDDQTATGREALDELPEIIAGQLCCDIARKEIQTLTGTGTVVQLAIGPLVPEHPVRRGIDQTGAVFPRQVNRLGSGGRQLVDEPTTIVLKLAPASEPASRFADEIAAALRRALGDSRAGAKVVASWTGANEKTVKNWLSGRYGPSGEHLVSLAQHSDEVLETFLSLAGRQDLMVALKLAAAEHVIEELLMAVRKLRADVGPDGSNGATG